MKPTNFLLIGLGFYVGRHLGKGELEAIVGIVFITFYFILSVKESL